MDDAAILAARQVLKDQETRLLREVDAYEIELKQLPLTTTEKEKQEAKKHRKELKAEEARRRDDRHCGYIKIGGVFFIVCTILGIGLYLIGGAVAMNQDKTCSMGGPIFVTDYPAQCERGFFTAGIVFFIIGISPILCLIAFAAGR